MSKELPAKVERYQKVMLQLMDAKQNANTSTSQWSVSSPWSRDEASQLQSHIHEMIMEKRKELFALEDAWTELIEMVDDGCVEEYADFTRAQIAKHGASMRVSHEEFKIQAG